jgi:hypothetical protein
MKCAVSANNGYILASLDIAINAAFGDWRISTRLLPTLGPLRVTPMLVRRGRPAGRSLNNFDLIQLKVTQFFCVLDPTGNGTTGTDDTEGEFGLLVVQ